MIISLVYRIPTKLIPIDCFNASHNLFLTHCLRPILFVGPTGTGKSMYVRHKLMTESKAGFVTPAFINFSAQSTANQIQVD